MGVVRSGRLFRMYSLTYTTTLTPEDCDKIVSKRDEWDKQIPNITEEQIESMIHDSKRGYLNRNELDYQTIVYPKLLNAQKMIPQFDVNNFTK